ncbi:GNAT family N-acetyltransferase [Vibrio europaeus]|uniref:GNAT family N-acetyltransferase n=1 Tax=Vibrio europaeus TaxID=300876 RepID=A0AAE7AYK7_9VIBR|nr:N-acetyltransferase [Vibrio europaeus]MDC5806210.1 GNAT family N-acetyltransferase [Vibrio europaeus]MDC5812524.1 GNAT family N-acetyltransferase [Vibrio europaeus]MDC5825640.1 GNAT family N-acetyltransferase [Vibrio europaeus]MDC5831080.1 GNAT family N-acetyltransferase [Vibrio europaeus]MDC5834036.1 GNAT family N-acetyltransferase [Vibrio europaeus]
MEVNLRAAREEDIQFLLDLRVLTMESYLEKDGVPCTEEENLYRIRYNFEDAQIIEIGSKKAGLFKASYLADKEQWYLFQIQVHPDFQNLRIGSYLINTLIHKAKQQGKSIGLSVLKSNPAFNLYRKLGFKVVEENEHEFELLLEA